MIKVIQVGLGPIGVAVARQVLARRGLVLVGAVDSDPAKVGRDLGEICQLGRRVRVKVSADISQSIRASKPDVAVLCTSSSLKRIQAQLEGILAHRVAIVSTTEELAYPTRRNGTLAKRIDSLAKRARVAVLGTGVNPGFVMDALPIMMTAVCESVTAIEVDRIQDASIRRLPFQQKIGAGLEPSAFMRKVEDGSVRHVGLEESIRMIAAAMGWRLDKITDEVRPKVATEHTRSAFFEIAPGGVCGLIQDGIGYRKGTPLVRLHMEAYIGAPASYDAIRISGTPPLALKVESGVHGDVATASIVVNSIPRILTAPPGIRTMRDMVLPGFFGG
jgi:hypothetical protein